jgi:hypothetical protein
VKFDRIDFGNIAAAINARFQGKGKISIHLNEPYSPVVAERLFASNDFITLEMSIAVPTKGVHLLVVVFHPGEGKTILLRQSRVAVIRTARVLIPPNTH